MSSLGLGDRRIATLPPTAAVAIGSPSPAWGQEVAVEREEEERVRVRSGDIVVIGRSLGKEEVAPPVQVLAGDELAHRRQGGLGETLAGLPGVHLDSHVDAGLKSMDDNLPRIPPGRLGARYEHTAGPIPGDAEYHRTFEQDKAASYETRTPGYDVLNATVSDRVDLGPSKAVELYVRGTNLTNDLAFSHTSFVKDQSPPQGRNVVIGMRHHFRTVPNVFAQPRRPIKDERTRGLVLVATCHVRFAPMRPAQVRKYRCSPFPNFPLLCV